MGRMERRRCFCVAWRHARCLWRRTHRVSQPGSGIPSPEHIPSLHLPGGFKIRPSWVDSSLVLSVIAEVVETRGCWGASKVGDDVSGEALHDFWSWGEAALSVRRTGGSSSGLSGGGATVGGTCVLTS